MTEELSEAVALRIALAARALPDMDVRRLMAALVQVLGPDINDANLARLPGKRLALALDDGTGAPEGEHLRQALDLLKGAQALPEEEALPELESRMPAPGTVQVACASNTSGRLDGHFGNCRRFLIFQVSPEAVRLVDRREVPTVAGGDVNTATRVGLIKDCAIVFAVSIGGPPAAKVVRAGVHPVKRPQGGDARAVATELVEVLATNPPPWLAQAAGVPRVEAPL